MQKYIDIWDPNFMCLNFLRLGRDFCQTNGILIGAARIMAALTFCTPILVVKTTDGSQILCPLEKCLSTRGKLLEYFLVPNH